MGPITAFKLIKEHKTIEKVIERLKKDNEDPKRKKKYIIPDPFNYEDARELFKNPLAIKDTNSLEVAQIYLKNLVTYELLDQME